jgi:hypothetical protein
MIAMRCLLLLLVLGAPLQAMAMCRRYGTQLECAFGGGQLVVGTQRAADPSYTGEFRPQTFQATRRVFDGRARLDGPFRIELQNVARDPGLCWKLGDETYCH